MTLTPTLTVVPATPVTAAASGPSPAAMLVDPERPGCSWYVVDAPHAHVAHAAA